MAKKSFLPQVIRPYRPPSNPSNPSNQSNQTNPSNDSSGDNGIYIGGNVHWNPLVLPNLNGLVIGTSGEGKSQTLLALASEMIRFFDNARIIIADLHDDLGLPGEKLYNIDPVSPWGINPLQLDLDPAGGGVALQIASVAATLKKSLIMGSVQEALLIEVLKACYQNRGIYQHDYESWKLEPPTFADLEAAFDKHDDKEYKRLKIKLNTLFSYGIFSKPQPPLNSKLIRLNLKALLKVPKLAPVALETLLKQLLDEHRLLGEAPGTLRTYIFIDEAGLVKSSPSLVQIAKEGRKFGLGCFLASQTFDDFHKDFLANSALKIILNVDSTERKKTSFRFRIDEEVLANLKALEALIRMRHDLQKVQIIPYHQRV